MTKVWLNSNYVAVYVRKSYTISDLERLKKKELNMHVINILKLIDKLFDTQDQNFCSSQMLSKLEKVKISELFYYFYHCLSCVSYKNSI